MEMRLGLFFGISFFLLAGCVSSKAKQEQNETAELHMQVATAQIQGGNYPNALKELLIAEDLSPENPMIQSSLGRVYFLRDRFDLAEKHYKKAIALNPEYTDAKNSLARAYIEYGQFKQAESLLKEVLADLTYVDFPRAYANYGILEFKRKNYDAAISYFKKSLERDRENCFTQVYLGRSYLETKEMDLAVSQLEKAVPFCEEAGSDEGLFYSAIALYRGGQIDKARLRFQELMRIYPSGPNFDKAQKMLQIIDKGTL